MQIKKPVFVLINSGILFLILGFIIESAQGIFDKNFTMASIIFFSASYVLLIVAFGYFWYHSTKLHKLHITEPVFFMGVIAAVLIWIYYLLRATIAAYPANLPLLDKIVLFYHPIAVALIFILTLVIHPAHKAKVIRTPIWYVSSGIFFYFLGYMAFAYSLTKQPSNLVMLLYSGLFLISAACFLLGFLVANKKFSHDLLKKQGQ
jgi:drug/metabolite transporter (DMT)-like permease